MIKRNYIVLTRDTYLRCSIDVLMQDVLMQNLYKEKTLCFCDVDSFLSIDELDNVMSALCNYEDIHMITISRGLWISRVLGTLIDLNMSDDFSKWRNCIIKGRKNHCRKVIEKLRSIKRHKILTQKEMEVIYLLRATNNITEAAQLARRKVKFFQALTISIAHKYNLRNSNELHFFIKKFII